jgi:hypothetical protein
LEASIDAIDGGFDKETKLESAVGAMRSIVPERHESLNEILGEFDTTDTTAAVTSLSKFPSIHISELLSADKITDPMTNKSAPTPRARGSTTALLKNLTFFKVIVLIPVTPDSPLVA